MYPYWLCGSIPFYRYGLNGPNCIHRKDTNNMPDQNSKLAFVLIRSDIIECTDNTVDVVVIVKVSLKGKLAKHAKYLTEKLTDTYTQFEPNDHLRIEYGYHGVDYRFLFHDVFEAKTIANAMNYVITEACREVESDIDLALQDLERNRVLSFSVFPEDED